MCPAQLRVPGRGRATCFLAAGTSGLQETSSGPAATGLRRLVHLPDLFRRGATTWDLNQVHAQPTSWRRPSTGLSNWCSTPLVPGPRWRCVHSFTIWSTATMAIFPRMIRPTKGLRFLSSSLNRVDSVHNLNGAVPVACWPAKRHDSLQHQQRAASTVSGCSQWPSVPAQALHAPVGHCGHAVRRRRLALNETSRDLGRPRWCCSPGRR